MHMVNSKVILLRWRGSKLEDELRIQHNCKKLEVWKKYKASSIQTNIWYHTNAEIINNQLHNLLPRMTNFSDTALVQDMDWRRFVHACGSMIVRSCLKPVTVLPFPSWGWISLSVSSKLYSLEGRRGKGGGVKIKKMRKLQFNNVAI